MVFPHSGAGGTSIRRQWIVLLEVAARSGDQAIGIETVGRLLEALPEAQEAVGLYAGERYALQTRIDDLCPAGALVTAVTMWRETVDRLDMPRWELARAEVLTRQEFEDERSAQGGPEYLSADDLLQRALHDPLTGLANRELFGDRVRVALDVLATTPGQLVVLRADIDRFGAVNRAAGYPLGDRMLVALGARLRDSVPGALAVARVGGDEFAIVLDVATDAEVARVAEIVLGALRAPVELDGGRLSVTASLGVAATFHRADPDELVRRAGLAMCLAKQAGGDCWRPYQRGVPVDAGRIDLESDVAPDRMAQVLLLQRVAAAANELATLREAAPAVLKEICALVGWPLGHLSLVDLGQVAPTGVWHIQGANGRHGFRAAREGRAFSAGEELAARVLVTGRPASTYDLVITDESADPADPDPVELADIRYAFALPVLVGTQVAAVLEFYSPWPQAIEGSVADVLVSVGVQLGRIVERDRAQVALARAERWPGMVDSVPAPPHERG